MLRRARQEALRALIWREKVREVIAARYASTENRRDLVRVGDVAKDVAAALDAENSPRHRAEVRQVCADMGWRRVTVHDHVPYYRFMVRR